MSEFSPDTIQFQKTRATATHTFSNPRLLQLEQWLASSPHEAHTKWLEQQIQLERYTLYSTFLQTASLSELQQQLRILREHLAAHEDPILPLVHYWLKQSEALELQNVSAYEKVLAERPDLQQHLSTGRYPFGLIAQAQRVDAFFMEMAQQLFPKHFPIQIEPESTASRHPSNSTPLLLTAPTQLPNGLPLSIYRRSATSWLRRAMRHFQRAQHHQFREAHLLQKCIKSLYACLTLDPHNTKAFLFLGWLEACAGHPEEAMKYLEHLRQGPHESEVIFLIRFLQHRPLL